ncbi:uncharacterized protein Dvar_40590 [Desulfosarcina variabilis str. Montpellier]
MNTACLFQIVGSNKNRNSESYSSPFSVATLIVKYGEQPKLGANPALFTLCKNLDVKNNCPEKH